MNAIHGNVHPGNPKRIGEIAEARIEKRFGFVGVMESTSQQNMRHRQRETELFTQPSRYRLVALARNPPLLYVTHASLNLCGCFGEFRFLVPVPQQYDGRSDEDRRIGTHQNTNAQCQGKIKDSATAKYEQHDHGDQCGK